MYTRSWHIIKNEKTRTFEVVEQADNSNGFTNKAYAMQRDGMDISCVILPVSNKNSSKETIKFIGYTLETGLYEKLLKEHQAIIMKQAGMWEE